MSCGLCPVISSSRKKTRPRRGWSSPKIALISVDLPAPAADHGHDLAVLRLERDAVEDVDLRHVAGDDVLGAKDGSVGPRVRSHRHRLRYWRMRVRLLHRTRAEIGVDHPLVRADLIRRPVRDHAALGHHDHAVGVVHHHLHVVLDEQERHALL